MIGTMATSRAGEPVAIDILCSPLMGRHRISLFDRQKRGFLYVFFLDFLFSGFF